MPSIGSADAPSVQQRAPWRPRDGLKTAIAKLLHASWQRCRVHFARNALAYAGRNGRRVVAAFIATAFAHRWQRHRSGPAGTAA